MIVEMPTTKYSYTSPEVAKYSTLALLPKQNLYLDPRAIRTSSTQSSTFPVFEYRGSSLSLPQQTLLSGTWNLLELCRLVASKVSAWVVFSKFSLRWFLKFETRTLFILGVFWFALAVAAVGPQTGRGWKNHSSEIGSFWHFRSRSVLGLFSESNRISAGFGNFVSCSTGSKKPLSPSGKFLTGFLVFGWNSLLKREKLNFLPARSVFRPKLALSEIGSELG